jgi:hypothetical protein
MLRKCCFAMSRIHKAYLAISLAPEGEDGTRTVCLARYGAFEVRLIEPRRPDGCACWLELYRHDIGMSLDSCSSDDLDDLGEASEYFISCARELHETYARGLASYPAFAQRVN